MDVTLTLWGCTISSAHSWIPSHTILLISGPSVRGGGRPTISLSGSSIVEVNPEMRDADWLRDFAQRLTRREHVNPEFPLNGIRVTPRLFPAWLIRRQSSI